MYMYIDYSDKQFYPKALLSPTLLQFPDELGNSLNSVLLNSRNRDSKYKNCKIWDSKKNWYKYTPDEVYDYLISLNHKIIHI